MSDLESKRKSIPLHLSHQTGITHLQLYSPNSITNTPTITSTTADEEEVYIIASFDDRTVRVYSLRSGLLVRTFVGHEGGIWTFGLIPGGSGRGGAGRSRLVTGSTDRSVRIWSLDGIGGGEGLVDSSRTSPSPTTTTECEDVFTGHTGIVRVLAVVHPDVDIDQSIDTTDETGPLIVSGSRDHTLIVWSIPPIDHPPYIGSQEDVDDLSRNPYYRFTLEGHTDVIRDLTAKGRTAISASYDTTVRVWDLVLGEERYVLRGHTAKVYSVVYDQERETVVSAAQDGEIRIWSLLDGSCLFTIPCHPTVIGLLRLHTRDEGRMVVITASGDGNSAVVDLPTGKLQQFIKPPPYPENEKERQTITALSVGKIGRGKREGIITGSLGGIYLHDLESGQMLATLLSEDGDDGTSDNAKSNCKSKWKGKEREKECHANTLTGVWHVVQSDSGRWCVAAVSRGDTVLDSAAAGGEGVAKGSQWLEVWDFW